MKFFDGFLACARWALAAVLLAGCASTEGGGMGVFDKIVDEDAPMYDNGPYQSGPPTRHLSRGTRLRVLSAAGAYAYIETVDGARGYVPVSAIGAQGSL